MKFWFSKFIVLLLIMFLSNGSAIADQCNLDDFCSVSEIYQDENKAFESDIAFIAESEGFSYEVVEESIIFQQAFEAFSVQVLNQFSSEISGMWVDPIPEKKGYIHFTGKIPMRVYSILENFELLNKENIVFKDSGLLNISEQKIRAQLAAEAIGDLGYKYAKTCPKQQKGILDILVQVSEREIPPSKFDLIKAMNSRIKKGAFKLSDRGAMISPDDIRLTIKEGGEPLFRFENIRAGNVMKQAGVNTCTSGFAVKGFHGDGLLSAGHCIGVDRVCSTHGRCYNVKLNSNVEGYNGDAGYFETGAKELPEFYAGIGILRKVRGTMPTATMVGKKACVFGFFSAKRYCHNITATNCVITYDNQ